MLPGGGGKIAGRRKVLSRTEELSTIASLTNNRLQCNWNNQWDARNYS